ncbi:MAG: TIGR00730 family Rossman fold protein [Acidimicrobiia bacterium]
MIVSVSSDSTSDKPFETLDVVSKQHPLLRRGAFADSSINDAIEHCVSLAAPDAPSEKASLAAEMVATALRLLRDDAPTGDIKLILSALKELRYTARVFAPYRQVRRVAIFGSARAPENSPVYKQAKEFARKIAGRGWMVITGGGPGVMAAGNEGAGARASFGLRIRLPSEPGANKTILGDPKLVNYKYFFSRKVAFVKESHAFVLLPGGFGTLDETFELLTLMQTGRSDPHPVVLLEPTEDTYWNGWRTFLEQHVLSRGYIDKSDLELMDVTEDVDRAVEIIERFYSVYHSQRFVDGRLVLRLRRLIPEEYLEYLTEKYSPIITEGRIEAVPPYPEEIEDNDEVDLPRIALWFDRRSFSQLRRLIDDINGAPLVDE